MSVNLWGKRQPPPVGAQLDLGDPISFGLIGCFLANEGAGNIVNNIGYSKRSGVGAGGATWAPGPIGRMIDLDGVNDYVSLASSASFINGDEGTFVGFAVKGSILANFTQPFGIRATGDNEIGVIDGNGEFGVFAEFFYTGATVKKAVNLASSLPLGSLFQVGISWSRRKDEMRAYLNGVQVGTTQTGLASFAGSATFSIGGNGGPTPGAFWHGKLGPFRVYNRPLAPAEIQRLFWQPYAGITAPRHKSVEAGAYSPMPPPIIMYQAAVQRAATY